MAHGIHKVGKAFLKLHLQRFNRYSCNDLRTDPRFNLILLNIQIMGANSMLPRLDKWV